jgi:hypothetical protein
VGEGLNLGRGITDDDREQYRAEETEKLDQIESTYINALARPE